MKEIRLFPNVKLVELTACDMRMLRMNCTCGIFFVGQTTGVVHTGNEENCWLCKHLKSDALKLKLDRDELGYFVVKGCYAENVLYEQAIQKAFLKEPLVCDN